MFRKNPFNSTNETSSLDCSTSKQMKVLNNLCLTLNQKTIPDYSFEVFPLSAADKSYFLVIYKKDQQN